VKLEKINCQICGSDSNKKLFDCSDRFNITSEKFIIIKCNECNFVYLNPRPDVESISKFYVFENYDPFVDISSAKSILSKIYVYLREFTVSWKRKQIEKIKKSGFILDFGCGTGEFLKEMENNNWKIFGVEKDENAVKYAREKLNLEVFSNSEFRILNSELKYDVITLWHSLEHIHNLKETIELLHSLLKQDGLMCIALPNIDSLDARFYKNKWIALDAPRHLYHFTPQSIQKFLNNSGFEIIKYQQMPLDVFYNTLMTEKLFWNDKSIFYKSFLLGRAILLGFTSYINGISLFGGNSSSVLYFAVRK
jgi:2-polyprenyl-3-methyl-5-hydroxy-6-metoxy-1,4-benzoquinol methylase